MTWRAKFAAVAVTMVLIGQPAGAAAAAATFTNPVATNRSDPHIIASGGRYYLTSTDGCVAGRMCVWESATLTGLGAATAVGLLTNTTGNLLDPAAWVKTGPHFKYHGGAVATASFVPIQTVDGAEPWFLVHANTENPGCNPSRVLRIQRMYWDPDGTPVLGYPVADGVPQGPPRGELGSTGNPNPYERGWGDAFGDAALGDTAHGRRTGTWTVTSRTEASVTSFGGTGWTQLFRASNPNYETYTVTVSAQWVATGTTSQYPKYGIYASYADRNNFVAAFIDVKYRVLATYAVVQGKAAGWQNAPLPAGFTATDFHRLSVRKTGATYRFSLDGVQLQQRTFTGTFPVLLNGQIGLVTEDTKANYRNLAVSDTW